MKAGDFFRQTDAFITEVCQPFISVNSEWDSIEIRRQGTDGISFLRMTDSTGDRFYFDITALDLQQIGLLVASVIATNQGINQITDRDQRRAIAKLFRN